MPAQQGPFGPADRAIERRNQHVIELEALGAVDGHDLHGIGARGARVAVQVAQQRLEVLGTQPLGGGGALGERAEETPRVVQLRLRVRIGRPELRPGRLQGVRDRTLATPLERLRKHVAHAHEPRELPGRAARETGVVVERLPDQLRLVEAREWGERRETRAAPGRAPCRVKLALQIERTRRVTSDFAAAGIGPDFS